jgi:anthranilate phosphoribosyltransferase
VGEHRIDAVAGGEPAENARDMEGILEGSVNGAKRDVVVANAGAAVYAAGEAGSLRDGVEAADAAIADGDAARKLAALRAGA